ncbi:NADP-dependent oxidoreductase [Cytobacillus sp. Sa5YUA1]|uniref:NADP-dependent oxidoreductase n=1 Tax=Cytobacillus stercorigallinarum TaxID=2762240 RepID=A0ABR8QM07_9BACI|nr:NADP-dependent oxidoreductase [Cytobacillus stercorigallinarum]MBD7936546.1 NADP-dependent oxidoreductase [Cytobacillus stercorigallinarum]
MNNRSILLVERPTGMPSDQNFKLVEKEEIPRLHAGEVLIQTIYLSVDPYMRGRMSGRKSYIEPFALNEVLSGGIVGQVIESKDGNYKVGDFVEGRLGWSDYNVAKSHQIRKLDPSIAPISTALGIVGMPGLTAYFGLLDIGNPKEGETVVVSGAAGAVGSTVGQIAKLKGCKVIGIVGTEEKCQYLKEDLHFDEVINYKTDNIKDKVKQYTPDGVDIYFDNVGGEISDEVMKRINYKARIILCGQISSYNATEVVYGPRIQGLLVQKSALMKGFIVGDYADNHEEGLKQLGEWVNSGKLQYRENIVEGLEKAPHAFIGLFKGDNLGKQLVKVSDY